MCEYIIALRNTYRGDVGANTGDTMRGSDRYLAVIDTDTDRIPIEFSWGD